MITDRVHEARLQKAGAVIVTDFHDGGKLKVRSTDHGRMDDVYAGVILAKSYRIGGKVLRQETEFNPGMIYSYVFPALKDGSVKCGNCGAVGTNALFSEGCPYCGAFYNMDYQTEIPGAREHGDAVTRKKKTPAALFLLIAAGCIAAGILLSVMTSRTANLFDYIKGAVLGGIAGGVICLIISLTRQKTTLSAEEVQKKREEDAALQRFRKDLEENGLSMAAFAGCLNLGLRDYYFGSDTDETRDVIDFDILDYSDRKLEKQDGKVIVSTGVRIRLVYARQDRVWSEECEKRVLMRKGENPGPERKGGLNITSCPYCGASIDLAAKRCSYCKTAFLYDRPLNIEKVS